MVTTDETSEEPITVAEVTKQLNRERDKRYYLEAVLAGVNRDAYLRYIAWTKELHG
jgi:hypothetical protein